jgi:hypothetical protein
MVDTANIFGTIWFRTHNDGDVMLYDTYNPMSNIGTSNNHLNQQASRFIPPGQAFWVRLRNDNATTSFSFHQRHAQPRLAGQHLQARGRRRHGAYQAGQWYSISDEAIIHFTTDAFDGFDAFDSEKMWASNIPQLYTTVGADSLVINGLYSTETNPIVDLGIKAPTAGDYTITASSITLNEEVWLEDRLLNTFQHLNQNPVYAFAIKLRQHRRPLRAAFRHDGRWHRYRRHQWRLYARVRCRWHGECIRGRGHHQGTITILDMAGRTVQTAAINGTRTVVATDLTTGIYLVRVETANGVETHR